MKYRLKQSDEKQEFSTGAQRDSQEGKSRPDLISPVFLDRLGTLLAKGAEHYGERNWEKGMPLSRFLASAMRHLLQTIDGQEDEDHAIQCAFNLMGYVHTQHRIKAGLLPAELDDMPHEKNLTVALTSPKKPPTIGRDWKVKKTFTTDNGARSFCTKCADRFTMTEEVDLQCFIGCGGSKVDYRCPGCGGSG